MAQIAASKSNKAIFTSDNPRNEEPQAILDDMMAGITADLKSKVLVILDREQAIKSALMFAKEGDVVLIAGKGHEKYQEVHGQRHHFDDVEQVNHFLNA